MIDLILPNNNNYYKQIKLDGVRKQMNEIEIRKRMRK